MKGRMSRQVSELENLLRAMIAEHRRLLETMVPQQTAMRTFDLKSIEEISGTQEVCRLRIATLETKRRMLVGQIARGARIIGEVKIDRLAEMFPEHRTELLHLRNELQGVIKTISERTRVSGKVAGAVLGHLNTVVRLISGVVEQAGLYTKYGVPQVSVRIGLLEAVG
jgi:FlgN protein